MSEDLFRHFGGRKAARTIDPHGHLRQIFRMANAIATRDQNIRGFYHQDFGGWVYWKTESGKIRTIEIIYPHNVNPHGHIVIKDGVICYWRRIDGTVLLEDQTFFDNL